MFHARAYLLLEQTLPVLAFCSNVGRVQSCAEIATWTCTRRFARERRLFSSGLANRCDVCVVFALPCAWMMLLLPSSACYRVFFENLILCDADEAS